MKIQGWYITPPDFDPSRKYPMQLHIHGGPHSMYGVGFNYGWQEHAANDYVILYTNPRGSTGYGSAFGNAIKNAYPSKDFDDLMAGVDALLAKGFVDPQNLFVTGCSGGGVLTAWTVGHTDRFAAASANCPVIDWLSFVGTTDGASWYYNFAKLPWEDPSEHIKRSPLTYVGNVKTPTMLMTGVNDLRTPMPQTEQFYSALKLRNVPTAMIRFNDEWHGTTSVPSNFMRTQLYLRYWFDKYKRGAEQQDDDALVGERNRSSVRRCTCEAEAGATTTLMRTRLLLFVVLVLVASPGPGAQPDLGVPSKDGLVVCVSAPACDAGATVLATGRQRRRRGGRDGVRAGRHASFRRQHRRRRLHDRPHAVGRA